MRQLFGYVVGVAAIFVLAGCASPARVEGMSINAEEVSRISAPPELRGNIAIKDVTGGSETNPMWKSNVGSSEFEQALEASLRAAGMLSPNRVSGKYQLTAHLEQVEQPFVGIDMTVSATVQYVLSERATGKVAFARKISAPYTAKFSDSVLGVERLRLANEGAIRENIGRFIEELAGQKLSALGNVYIAQSN
ncbi:MAG TPA: hypothetical protein VLT89_04920 [Usitatibacter sp.]|nr:hypothetical protein [Usitatibacter sp.]